MNQISVFSYRDYRTYLKEFIEAKIAERNLSYRYFSRKAGISSPNFLQQVVSGTRALTPQSALKVATGLQLKGGEKKFFLELVRLSRVKDTREQGMILDSLSKLARAGKTETLVSTGFHSSWLHSIIWELASVPNFVLNDENLNQHLGHLAPLVELKKSRDFLIAGDFLRATERPGIYEQMPVHMRTHNDLLDIDLRRKHQKFLEHLIKTMELPLAQREIQGITIAVAEDKIAHIKKRLREFTSELAMELANDSQADRVIRIELGFAPLTRPA